MREVERTYVTACFCVAMIDHREALRSICCLPSASVTDEMPTLRYIVTFMFCIGERFAQ